MDQENNKILQKINLNEETNVEKVYYFLGVKINLNRFQFPIICQIDY